MYQFAYLRLATLIRVFALLANGMTLRYWRAVRMLIPVTKQRLAGPGATVDLKGLLGSARSRSDVDGMCIGALASPARGDRNA
jgi:CO/xanthine dehydrogenase FAD-binding subunit